MQLQALGAGFPAGLLPIVRSLAQDPEVQQRLWRDFHGAPIKVKRLARRFRNLG
jgi:hypothetical protein